MSRDTPRPVFYSPLRRLLDTASGLRDRRHGTAGGEDTPATPWLRENLHTWADRSAAAFARARARADTPLRQSWQAGDRAAALGTLITVGEAEIEVLQAAESGPAFRLGTERDLLDAQVADRCAITRRAATRSAARRLSTLREEQAACLAAQAEAAGEAQHYWAAAWWQAERLAEFHRRRSAVYSRAFLRGLTADVGHPLHRQQGPVNPHPVQCPWLAARS